MPIRKFIEEIGEKILPVRRNAFPVAGGQQRGANAALAGGARHYLPGVGADESATAIRRYLETRRTFSVPHDLFVFFDEIDAVVILGGTVPDERTRELIVEAAGNIHGVERVDDRLNVRSVLPSSPGPGRSRPSGAAPPR